MHMIIIRSSFLFGTYLNIGSKALLAFCVPLGIWELQVGGHDGLSSDGEHDK